MNTGKKDPVLVVVSVMTVLLIGGFLLAVYVGMSGRKTETARRYLGFRSPASASPGYFESVRQGAAEIQKRAEIWGRSFFAGTTASSDSAAGTRWETSRDRIADDDSYEKDFNENYDGDYASGRRSGLRSSWADSDGGRFSSGGSMGSGGYESAPEGSRRKVRKAATGGGTASSAAGGPAPTSHAVPGGPPQDGDRAAPPRRRASLPSKNAGGTAGLNSGGFSPEHGGEKFKKGGGLQGMSGSGPGADLNGASESMKTEAQNSYKSGAAGGAAAAAAGAAGASGGASAAVPKAPEPKKADADEKAGDAAAEEDSDLEPGTDEELYADSSGAEEPDLIRSVVAARLKGTDVKYVPEEKASGEPEEALLQAGAAAITDENQNASKTDPANFDDLSEERRKAMREEIHVFLKKVENKYGAMTDIYDTPCRLTPDLCKEHGISGNYLTMITAKGAKLVLGTKYLNGKWRRYTIDFKKPRAARP